MSRKFDPRTPLARALRASMTEAEAKLWFHLRSRQMKGVKFRRQEPLGPYIADFCSLNPRLVIEIDGSQHAEHATADAKRTAELQRMGFRVIRFWNNEVLANIEGVTTAIEQEIECLMERLEK